MPTRDDVIAYLKDCTDREIAEVFRRLPDRDFGGVRYRRAVATVYVNEAGVEEPPEFCLLAYEDAEHYAGWTEAQMPEEAGQYATCGACGTKVVCTVKRGICPVCYAKVYLT